MQPEAAAGGRDFQGNPPIHTPTESTQRKRLTWRLSPDETPHPLLPPLAAGLGEERG